MASDSVPQTRAELAVTKETLDSELRDAVSRWHRLRWIAVAVLAFVVLCALAGLGIMLARSSQRLAQDDRRINASCAWWADVSRLPLTNVPGTSHPSQLGVGLVADSRRSFVGQQCPGHLAPASPALIRGLIYYHLPPAP